MKIIEQERIYTVNPDCDLDRLYHIMKETNAYVERGEECIVTLGHTSDDDPDHVSVSVGTAKNFKVVGEDLYADLSIDDIWEDARELKVRRKKSVEIWADDVISRIALLAVNRPRLELGSIRYQMPDRGIGHSSYQLDEPEPEGEEMTKDEINQLVSEAISHSELFARVLEICEKTIPSLMEQITHINETLASCEKNDAEMNQETVNAEEVIDPEAVAEGLESDTVLPEEKAKEDTKEEDKDLEKNDTFASADNTYVAGLGIKKKDKYQMDKELVADYQDKLLKSEQEKADLIDKSNLEKAELLEKYQMAARKNELNELSKTYSLDADEEFGMVCKMDDAQFEQHKKIILARYQKSPIGRKVNPVQTLPGTGGALDTVVLKDRAAKATALALAEDISYADALKRV